MVVKDNAPIWVFDSQHIKEGSLKFSDEICTPGNFDLGACVSNSFECDIINFDETFPSPDVLEGSVVRLYFSLEEYSWEASQTAVVGLAIVGNAIVGHREGTVIDTIRRGTYRLDPVKQVGRIVHISGNDFMSDDRFNSANIDGYSFNGKTCMSALIDLGFPIVSNFPNSNYLLPDITVSEEYGFTQASRRTVLEFIAQICGCYARFNNYGALELKPFATSGTETVIRKIMEVPDVDYYPVEVTGVYVSGIGDVYCDIGEDGYYMFIDKNPFITSETRAIEIADHVWSLIEGLTVIPFTLTQIADPATEAGDLIEFTFNGKTTHTMIMSMQYGLQELTTLSLEVDMSEHQNADTLLAAVPETVKATHELYNGDNLKKIINTSSERVQINAKQININGVISANETFKILADGSVDIKNGGEIGGFHIGSESLYNGMDSMDSKDDGVYVGTDGIALGGGNFSVTEEGDLTSMSGHIGAWGINKYGFWTDDISYAGEHTDAQYGMILYSDTTGSVLVDKQFQYVFRLKMNDPSQAVVDLSLITMALSGDIHCFAVTQWSDRRLKEDIKYLVPSESAERVYKFRPCSYKSKIDGKIHRGFIAQDLEAYIDGWIPVDENEKGIKSIAYTELITDLVATIQSQDDRIKLLEEKVERLMK